MEQLWKSGAVYQIYPRSFCDSNGDGVGDIPGIISKLDYIASIGVKIVWLSPIYKSPKFDMGYDVADYYEIDPEYGTMEDFERLLAEAKKRGLRIVMDLVVNHTSSEHPWFRAALKGEMPYHDYYIFKKGKKEGVPPNNWTSMFTGTAWEYVPELGEYYLHLYDKAQPDLNWRNPKVLEEVENILRFYLDKGVYGFRCDVINQIYKESFEDGAGRNPSGRGQEHYLMTEGNHRILRTLYEDVFSKYEDHIVVGETFNVDIENGIRFLRDKELDMFFTFEHVALDKGLFGALPKKVNPAKLREVLYKYQKSIPWNANYWENHDQHRCIARFGSLKYRDASAKALGTLLLTLKGTPFIYQGQELGMLDAPMKDPETSTDCAAQAVLRLTKGFHLPKWLRYKICNGIDRDSCRAPMSWDNSINQGFTPGDKAWLLFAEDDGTHNVACEDKNPESVLNFYRKMLDLRAKHEELTHGNFDPLPSKGPLFAFRRVLGKASILVLINLSAKAIKLPVYLRNIEGKTLLSLGEDIPAGLPPFGVRAIDVG
ncbi:MAG: alpha-glucosidase [Bacilli bacterium]|nr:alpha-glucosidase [Bacilli bacterium]